MVQSQGELVNFTQELHSLLRNRGISPELISGIKRTPYKNIWTVFFKGNREPVVVRFNNGKLS